MHTHKHTQLKLLMMITITNLTDWLSDRPTVAIGTSSQHEQHAQLPLRLLVLAADCCHASVAAVAPLDNHLVRQQSPSARYFRLKPRLDADTDTGMGTGLGPCSVHRPNKCLYDVLFGWAHPMREQAPSAYRLRSINHIFTLVNKTNYANLRHD